MGKYTRLTIHTDGASRGNPGPAATGIHIADDTTSQTVAEFGFKLGKTTNNEAEYQAFFQAVEWLLERKELLADDIHIRFHLDSKLVVFQLLGLWRIKEPRLKPLAGKVQSCLLQLPGKYTFEHISRKENTYADRLANDTLDKRAPDSHPFP
jgi:ribonuclease HI